MNIIGKGIYCRQPLPVKGNLIKLDLDGKGNKEYRVLFINDTVAKVLGMNNIGLTRSFNTTSKTGIFTNGTTGQLYSGGNLDTYLNTTWYNTLSATAKAAIVPESRTQYMYQHYYNPDTPNTPTYTYQYQTGLSASDYDNADLTDSILVGDRNVFALDLKDIFDYFGKACITSNELIEMWTNQTSAVVDNKWLLSSAETIGSSIIWLINGNDGSIEHGACTVQYRVRPAFNIDLSKIPYSIV